MANGAMKVGPGVLPQDGERLRDSACSLIRVHLTLSVKQRPLHFKFSFARAQDVATDIIIMRLQVLLLVKVTHAKFLGGQVGGGGWAGVTYCDFPAALLLSTYRARLNGDPQVA